MCADEKIALAFLTYKNIRQINNARVPNQLLSLEIEVVNELLHNVVLERVHGDSGIQGKWVLTIFHSLILTFLKCNFY